MKYKIGDKVRVRKDLVLGNKYGGIIYASNMDKFKNKECVITSVTKKTYHINGSGHWWTDEMLEPVDEGALLKYALEKLGMSKEELENEMNEEDDEDMKKAKEIVRINKEADTYCDSFNWECQGCKVKEFKDKYRRFGRMICSDVYKYLKEKGEI